MLFFTFSFSFCRFPSACASTSASVGSPCTNASKPLRSYTATLPRFSAISTTHRITHHTTPPTHHQPSTSPLSRPWHYHAAERLRVYGIKYLHIFAFSFLCFFVFSKYENSRIKKKSTNSENEKALTVKIPLGLKI